MKVPCVLILSASLVSFAHGAEYRLRIFGPAYGTPANPVPDARIIPIPPGVIPPPHGDKKPEPLYQCERKDCSFQTR